MESYVLYDLKVTTLTPLHIGSGVELLNEYDFAIHDGKTWRLNDTAILKDHMPEDDPEIASRLALTPPGRMLEDKDFENKDFFHYVLNGEPRSEQEAARLREQIKSINYEPFIPGSSFKGALRTAIAWHGWDEMGMVASEEDVYEESRKREKKAKSPKFVGQVYERPLFGEDPNHRGKDANHDLLRSLQVTDSKAFSINDLAVLNTQIFMHDGIAGTPIEVEAILPQSKFNLRVKIDLALFSDWARKQGLHLLNSHWVTDFAQIATEHAKARARGEMEWLQGVPGTKKIYSFYEKEILNRSLEKGQFLLQFGWGTGWENTTFGSRLQANDDFMETIIREYKLSMNKEREAGDLFPESRHFAVKVISDESISLTHPFGWVLVNMTKVEHG
jgi:CRISPR-associated protein Csm5